MAIKITSKKTRSVNNRPNCLKITNSSFGYYWSYV